MPQYVYLKLGYEADKTTKESAIAMLNEGGADYPELLSLGEVERETKESFCCSRMAQAVKGKIFKPIHYDTDLTKIEYYSFSFRVDSKLSVCAIIHYCPFCGKKIGVKETKGENNKGGWKHTRVTVEQELKDIDWAIQTLEKILHNYASTGPHSEVASDLSGAKKRKRILLGKLASTDNIIDIIPHWFIGEPDVIQLHNECVDKINELVRAHNIQKGGGRT